MCFYLLIVGVSLWQPDNDQNNIASGNLLTLNSFGETFMDTICKNACSGHDVARVSPLPSSILEEAVLVTTLYHVQYTCI